VIGGRVEMSLDNLPAVQPHVEGGKLRALAVTTAKRWPELPDAPTVAEAGLPGYEASVWWGLVAPARTTPEIVRQLNAEINKALADSAISSKLKELGVVITPGTPEQFADFIESQTALWSAVIKSAGIRPD